MQANRSTNRAYCRERKEGTEGSRTMDSAYLGATLSPLGHWTSHGEGYSTQHIAKWMCPPCEQCPSPGCEEHPPLVS